MLRPVIMIGCGGSGQKAVRYVRDVVRRRLEHSGWNGGVPQSWRFIGLDTLNVQESPGEIPTQEQLDKTLAQLQLSMNGSRELAIKALKHAVNSLVEHSTQNDEHNPPFRHAA